MFGLFQKGNEKKDDEENKKIVVKGNSLFQDAMEMSTGALVIYIFADIRDMAREGELTITLDDLKPPLTGQQVIERIKGNAEVLKEKAIEHEALAERLEALKNAKAHQEGNVFDALFGKKPSHTIMLTHFVDDRSDKEIVHAVVVNTARKRVTVMFRGSVTQQDFMQDAKCGQRKVENPVAALVENPDNTTETIGLHTGFYEYLFKEEEPQEAEEGKGEEPQEQKEGEGEEEGEEEEENATKDIPAPKRTRLQQVIQEAKEQLQANPGFRLYITGHSLGGALSTMFGFYAATDDSLMEHTNGPIVIYSVASPYVGNWKFRQAFQELERQKRIQHLRISNAEDMVTLLPFASLKATAMSPLLSLFQGAGNLYKHVGIRLQMTAKSEDEEEEEYVHSLYYTKDQANSEDYCTEIQDALRSGKSLAKAFGFVITNNFDIIVKYHSCDEYEKRLKTFEKELSTVTLDGLYADKGIVGNVMDQDYKPIAPGNGYQRFAKAFGALGRSNSSKQNLEGGKKEELEDNKDEEENKTTEDNKEEAKD